MLVYSKKIIRFIKEIEDVLKKCLSDEVGLKVAGRRFYDKRQTASYPICIVIYNHKSMLGYFDASFFELGFHECLMHCPKEQLHQIIRHELAHYLTFIEYGGGLQPHGEAFKAICQRFGWGEAISRATICLEEGASFEAKESSIFRKVQKLMALATSSNKHEAEQALIKSQQLLLKHNIETTYMGAEEEEKIILKRILQQKRECAKMRAIAKILQTFFVTIVYRRTADSICLEMMGSTVNVEIAEYVASVLCVDFDKLWLQAKIQANLKGMIAKNSFFLGVAKGYCTKVESLKKDYSSDMAGALIALEKKLVEMHALVYPRLSKGSSQAAYCAESSAIGEQMGRELTLNAALGQSSFSTRLLT